MGFKLGLFAGAAAGYVLGTRAGRERFVQIQRATEALRGSQTARLLEQSLHDAWDTAQDEWPAAATIGEAIDHARGDRD